MPPPERRTRWQRLWSATSKFLVDQFLLVSYLVAITIALAWPAPGQVGRGAAVQAIAPHGC